MVINIHEKEAQAKTSSAWNDILNFQNQLSDEEQILQSSVKSYCRDKLLPRIVNDNRNENFDRSIFTEMGKLGILGSYLNGYGCAGSNFVSYGLIAREIERIDSAYRSVSYTHLTLPTILRV